MMENKIFYWEQDFDLYKRKLNIPSWDKNVSDFMFKSAFMIKMIIHI